MSFCLLEDDAQQRTTGENATEPESPRELTRRDVRSLIFHLLYAMDAHDYEDSFEAIVDMFNRGFDLNIKATDETFIIANGVVEDREALDKFIEPLSQNWRLDRIGLSTKLILRLAIWELKKGEPAPSIVINEAIELAKCFAEKDSFKFINGVLDEAVKAMGLEVAAQ